MAPPKRPWFRFYVEAIDDPKLARLSPAQCWLWTVVLACARRSCEPGTLMVAAGVPMDLDDLVRTSRVKRREAQEGIDLMVALGMLVEDGICWHVPRFLERQYESDSSTDRAAKHRGKASDATPMQRPIDVVATSPETETETETETEKNTPTALRPVPFAEDFGGLWEIIPKRKTDTRKAALGVYQARRREGISAADLLLAATNYRDDPDRRAKPDFTMSATRFLGPSEVWKSYLEKSSASESDFVVAEGNDWMKVPWDGGGA